MGIQSNTFESCLPEYLPAMYDFPIEKLLHLPLVSTVVISNVLEVLGTEVVREEHNFPSRLNRNIKLGGVEPMLARNVATHVPCIKGSTLPFEFVDNC